MFLSRIRIRPERLGRASVRRAFSDGYAAHTLLWSFFPHDPEAERDFLYREDRSRGVPQLYLLSRRRPELPSDDYEIATKAFAPQIQASDRLAFALRVNPVIRRTAGPGAGKRHDVVMDAKTRAERAGDETDRVSGAVAAWLERRAEAGGFRVGDGAVIHSYRQHRLLPGKSRNPITFSTVDIDGVLTVISPQPFLRLLANGLGASRAFGCGLMLVRRA